MAPSVHALRSMYAAYVHHVYVCDCTFNIMAMRVLGHSSLEVSLSYNNAVLHGAEDCAGCLGALP